MKKIICICLMTTLALGVMACAGLLFKNYGRIDSSQEATMALESYSINPGFRYYISGPAYYPNAIMALDRNCRLDPATLWKEVEMTAQKMKELVKSMQTRASEYGEVPWGFDLMDDKGVRIGLWYSIPSARTYVRMQEDGTVQIATPELNPYESGFMKGGPMRDKEF